MRNRRPAATARATRLSAPTAPCVSPPSVEDKDACAIYASVRKDATPSHEPIPLALESLQKMLHRAGNVDGEGDGCGLLVDIPTKIWAEEVRQGGHNPSLALDDAFAVAHVFVERSADLEKVRHDARELLGAAGFRILAERVGAVDSAALGPTAREEEPHFWQFAGLVPDAADSRLGPVQAEGRAGGEARRPRRLASRGTTCVYKVMGAPKVLGAYYPDLTDERFETIGCFGHNRYSTNTWPVFTRVQPFGVLGHNGEINTIEQLRQEARMLGVPIGEGNSDSQDLNRTIETLCRRDGLSPGRGDGDGGARRSSHEIAALPEELHSFYMYLRQTDGPVRAGPGRPDRPPRGRVRVLGRRAGPAPAVADGDPDDFVFSSEPGVVSVEQMPSRAEADGPRREVHGHDRPRQAQGATLHPHEEMLREVRKRWLERTGVEEVAPYEPSAQDRRPARGPARSPATPPPAPPTRSRSRTASWPASAGSATTSSSSSRWPPTAPSRSARSATTGRWPRSRPSARTWPTTSRRRSRSSPTRRSTASARSSTSPPARSSAAAR